MASPSTLPFNFAHVILVPTTPGLPCSLSASAACYNLATRYRVVPCQLSVSYGKPALDQAFVCGATWEAVSTNGASYATSP